MHNLSNKQLAEFLSQQQQLVKLEVTKRALAFRALFADSESALVKASHEKIKELEVQIQAIQATPKYRSLVAAVTSDLSTLETKIHTEDFSAADEIYFQKLNAIADVAQLQMEMLLQAHASPSILQHGKVPGSVIEDWIVPDSAFNLNLAAAQTFNTAFPDFEHGIATQNITASDFIAKIDNVASLEILKHKYSETYDQLQQVMSELRSSKRLDVDSLAPIFKKYYENIYGQGDYDPTLSQTLRGLIEAVRSEFIANHNKITISGSDSNLAYFYDNPNVDNAFKNLLHAAELRTKAIELCVTEGIGVTATMFENINNVLTEVSRGTTDTKITPTALTCLATLRQDDHEKYKGKIKRSIDSLNKKYNAKKLAKMLKARNALASKPSKRKLFGSKLERLSAKFESRAKSDAEEHAVGERRLSVAIMKVKTGAISAIASRYSDPTERNQLIANSEKVCDAIESVSPEALAQLEPVVIANLAIMPELPTDFVSQIIDDIAVTNRTFNQHMLNALATFADDLSTAQQQAKQAINADSSIKNNIFKIANFFFKKAKALFKAKAASPPAAGQINVSEADLQRKLKTLKKSGF